MPISSVVTPCRTLGSWSGSLRIVKPPWEWTSIKPGETTWPVASITRAASTWENVAADYLYVFASDADTGVEAWASCAVDYLAVGYQEIKHVFISSGLYP